MSDVTQAVADLAQGALVARAAEPAHGEPAQGEGGDAGHTHERACLNCATPLLGSHCHACGQAAHVHRTLGAFLHDLLHGVFHFEGKIWRTLPLLAWRPGRLTREYIDGRRASYVSPIALFLFVVFVTFAVFNLTAGADDATGNTPTIVGDAATVEKRALAELARTEAQLAAARTAGRPTEAIEGRIAGQREALEGIRAVRRGELPKAIASADAPGEAEWAQRINTVWRHARENPELVLYKLQSSAYKYSWLLIPLSVPFVWLLFPLRRRFHLYDHTVFVTYSLSFMLILLAAGTAISVWSAADGLIVALLLFAPFHMYRQLRETYALGRFGAVWRAWLLIGFAMLALTLFAVAILGLSLG